MHRQQRSLWANARMGAAPWLGLALGLGLALLLAVSWLRSPAADLVALVTSLLISGLLSVAVGAVGMAWLRRGRMRIWLQITLTYLFGVGVALCNIFITARLMFISTHDLPLLALLILFAAVIATGLGAALSHVFAQRVSALNQGAAALATGDLTVRVPLHGDDELAALARAFNHMADQLAAADAARQQQEAARRDLIAAVSHDLRTPLASLRLLTEALADGVVDDADTTARYLDTMRAQIGQLNQLIEDLFKLARLDARALVLDLQPVVPGELVSDVVAGISPQAAAKGVQLAAQISPGVGLALVAPQQIIRVLDNLLVNAIRHTPSGGCITVGVAQLPGDALVHFEVADTGEGITAEALPHVFEWFYRGEKSRSRMSGGAGLGLAIARGIVEAHGGTIKVESIPGRGTCVRFTVPRAG